MLLYHLWLDVSFDVPVQATGTSNEASSVQNATRPVGWRGAAAATGRFDELVYVNVLKDSDNSCFFGATTVGTIYSTLLHTEAAVVALEAGVAADHTPARRVSPPDHEDE